MIPDATTQPGEYLIFLRWTDHAGTHEANAMGTGYRFEEEEMARIYAETKAVHEVEQRGENAAEVYLVCTDEQGSVPSDRATWERIIP